jgi:hypothetical protein
MDEQWKPIPGYEGIYSISSIGRTRVDIGGRGRMAGMILKPRYTTDGYIKYMLRKDGKSRAFLSHRLVYAAFVRPLGCDEEIDHINGIKDDNAIGNLEPVSKLVNMQRSFARGRNMARGSRVSTSKLTEELVGAIKNRYRSGAIQARICEEFGLPKSQVSKIILGKTWAHVL